MPGVCRVRPGSRSSHASPMTDDDRAWAVRGMSLGADPAGAVVDLVLSGSLCRWLEELPTESAAGEWRALGDGRFAVVLHLGGVDVDAVLQRAGDAYVGRAVARARPGAI